MCALIVCVINLLPMDELIESLIDVLNEDLVEVDGYTREDGTEVDSYFRTMPDDDLTNNLGFWDLVNAD